jgi:hypothetical protein
VTGVGWGMVGGARVYHPVDLERRGSGLSVETPGF